MTLLLLLAVDQPVAGLPSLAVYGVAAVPMFFLITALRWALQQMKAKDDVIAQQNNQLSVQSTAAIAQAERLAPLIAEAARVIDAAVRERKKE